MIYSKLNEQVYLKSRYELMALLENIQPAKGNVFEGLLLSSDTANLYEEKIDTYFSQVPFSEERLALFSHMASNEGVKDDLRNALNVGHRTQAWFAMRYACTDTARNTHNAISRCIYEANVFGLFDNPNEVTESEIESITHFLNSVYKSNLTYLQYILDIEDGYDHPLCIHQLLKEIERKTEKRVVKGCLAKNIFYP